MKDRRYIILRKHIQTGEIEGYCEYSFSMGFEKDRAEVYGVFKTGKKSAEDSYQNYLNYKCWEKKKSDSWWEGNQKAGSPNQREWFRLRATVEKLRDRHKGDGYEYKLFRLGKHCPITIDYSEINTMRKGKMKYDKFLWRNQLIKEKFPEKW